MTTLLERVRAYALAGSAAIEPTISTVEASLRTQFGIADRARLEIAVHPNGFINAFDTRELWERNVPPSLPSAKQAEARAKAFLAGLAQQLAPLAIGETPLIYLPPLPAQPLELLAVAAPGKRHWDHWLYRTQPKLAPGYGQRAVSVFGSQIEVRVGHGGSIIGYCARWRPITGQTRGVAAVPLSAAHHDHHGPTSSNPSAGLVYVLEGAMIPQHYLSTYHVISSGHHFDFVSASELSLVIRFTLDDDEDSTGVTAIVEGGSGEYDFDWCAFPMLDPFGDRIDLGSGTLSTDERDFTSSRIRIAKGAWRMILHVIDRVTGAFKHYQELVFSSPFEGRAEAFYTPVDPPRVSVQDFELSVPDAGVA